MNLDPFQSPISIALFVVCLYSVVLFIISCLGWRQLAAKYEATSKPSGVLFRGACGRISPLSIYRRCLNVVASPAGIYVETQLPWRLFHRPLFFPWRHVTNMHSKPNAGFFWPVTRVAITTDIFDLHLGLPKRAAAEFQLHAPHATNVA